MATEDDNIPLFVLEFGGGGWQGHPADATEGYYQYVDDGYRDGTWAGQQMYPQSLKMDEGIGMLQNMTPNEQQALEAGAEGQWGWREGGQRRDEGNNDAMAERDWREVEDRPKKWSREPCPEPLNAAAAGDVGGTSKRNWTREDSNRYEGNELRVGSHVQVEVNDEPKFGVVRWIGMIPGECMGPVAGVEMDTENVGATDGSFNGRRYFRCSPMRGFFVPLEHCCLDRRYYSNSFQGPMDRCDEGASFGVMDSPVVPGVVPPVSAVTCNHSGEEELPSPIGRYRGIQGHNNSCYLDATLFSMFTFTSVFDGLLFRPPSEDDVPEYTEVQRVLREEIVNPLRKNLYVRADRVMKLRQLLEKLSSVSGLTGEEKDPEEFLTSLVAQILRADPFLKLSSGQEAFLYQLFVEKDDRLSLPSVQQLFEQSILASDVKLKEVPSCLIVQMPRFGKSFKVYPRILPSQLLDVTDIIEDSPRQCIVCGKLASHECRECFGQCGSGLESIAFCSPCLETAHGHERRRTHHPIPLSVPPEFAILQDHCPIPRLYMELFAVVCIETSHYVAFVRQGSGPDAPWCFFDSMADREGRGEGHNVPAVTACPDLPLWLSEEGVRALGDSSDNRRLPEHARRLLCDAYMCMYQSPDVMMYR
ncbi:ubiquitin carboxyl-terminal hydrolase CYLD isoform X1 [Hetaerina americana]|uniref:ubiquitin carboxyl-terminal hydrolase CYLD isoform X1 n=3 Tax=Hetaerina americana TaxID=62018 RepID=UPI003A7F1A5C